MTAGGIAIEFKDSAIHCLCAARPASGAFSAFIPESADRGDTIVIGTNAVCGALHQFGGVILPKRAKAQRFMLGSELKTRMSVAIPARPFLGVSQGDREELEARSGKFLDDTFLGA